jgi:hypothetical protein
VDEGFRASAGFSRHFEPPLPIEIQVQDIIAHYWEEIKRNHPAFSTKAGYLKTSLSNWRQVRPEKSCLGPKFIFINRFVFENDGVSKQISGLLETSLPEITFIQAKPGGCQGFSHD